MIATAMGRQQFFRLLVSLAVASIAGGLLLSVAYRLYKDKPILRPDFPDVRFLEKWRSARSSRNLFSRPAGMRSSLWIAVTRDHLWVSPHFPFNLMFVPEMLHLDYCVPGKKIIAVEEVSFFQGSRFQVRFRHATGEEDSFEIEVSNAEAFKKAVAAIRAHQ